MQKKITDFAKKLYSLWLRRIWPPIKFVARKTFTLKNGLILVIFILSFFTRFGPATYPTEGLVFDESYFLPQVESYVVNRYFFDIHPPLGKSMMYLTTTWLNPDAAEQLDPEKLANKVEDYKTPLNIAGIRLAPKIVGTLVPVLMFLVTCELLKMFARRQQGLAPLLISFGIGLFGVFSNIITVESRYALLTPFLLCMMLLALYGLFKYYNAKEQRGIELWFIFASIGLGLALSVKWLALSIVPIFGLVILVKEFIYPKTRKLLLQDISIYLQRFVFLGAAALAVYLGFFYWHFNQLEHYSPAAWEVSEQYQEELKTGEKQVGFIAKVLEWHQIAVKYSENVPKLDYTKPDEIGSMWVTWPIMARPISYYWQTDGDGIYDHVFLIGNPVLWVLSLVGVLGLGAMGVAKLLVPGAKFGLSHFIVILLYFGNWLPFAMIERVMYLYHYIPAFMFGLIAFGLFANDFVVPRLMQARHFVPRLKLHDAIMAIFISGILLLISAMVGFFIYAPFTYLLPLDRDGFYDRVLLKEWNMVWPADK